MRSSIDLGIPTQKPSSQSYPCRCQRKGAGSSCLPGRHPHRSTSLWGAALLHAAGCAATWVVQRSVWRRTPSLDPLAGPTLRRAISPFLRRHMPIDSNEATSLLSGLVAVESTNPWLLEGAAGEAAVARYISDWLAKSGISAKTEE